MLDKKTLILILILVVLALAFFYPKDFTYVSSGKGDAMNYREESSCFGIKNVYQPECLDCLPVTDCFGILYDKRCFSLQPDTRAWVTALCK